MRFHLNENKPSKTMLQTLCSKAISALPKIHPIKAEPKTRGTITAHQTSSQLTHDIKRLGVTSVVFLIIK